MAQRAFASAALLAGLATAGSVWPMPQVFNQGSTSLQLSPSLTFSCAGACPDPLPAAFQRYSSLIFFAGKATAYLPAITNVAVNVKASAALKLGVSENYTLTVPASGGTVTITADTQWGALRGLETFSQLAVWNTNGSANVYTISNAPVSITDFPRFPWRGVLIDSSRHYLTVSAILSTLDAMSYNKMNRLHWHVVDDNSWPLYSESYPNFTVGAYAPSAIYTHADVQTIVQYAWERGIAVVPEFDGPAHAAAWGKGYPNLVISCADGSGQILLNPLPDGGVYDTIRGLLTEFVPLFQTDFIHFGGDEVETMKCWQQDARVQAFMQQQGYTNITQVRDYFQVQVQKIAEEYNLSAMFWEEVYDQGYTIFPSTIVDIWLSDQELLDVIKAGNRVVQSFGFYLDQQTPAGSSHYFWVDTWQNFYLQDALYGANVTAEEAARVLGFSASQWGEQVDASNIHSRMWPRASATAERMWSDMNLRDLNAALIRLEAFRCHMVQRGIGAGPIRPSDQVGYCPLPGYTRFHRMHEQVVLPAHLL